MKKLKIKYFTALISSIFYFIMFQSLFAVNENEIASYFTKSYGFKIINNLEVPIVVYFYTGKTTFGTNTLEIAPNSQSKDDTVIMPEGFTNLGLNFTKIGTDTLKINENMQLSFPLAARFDTSTPLKANDLQSASNDKHFYNIDATVKSTFTEIPLAQRDKQNPNRKYRKDYIITITKMTEKTL